MKRIFFILLTLSLLTACEYEQQTGVDFSCPSDYTIINSECCLDQDANSVCDKNEFTTLSSTNEQSAATQFLLSTPQGTRYAGGTNSGKDTDEPTRIVLIPTTPTSPPSNTTIPPPNTPPPQTNQTNPPPPTLGEVPPGCRAITNLEIINDQDVNREEVAYSGIPLAKNQAITDTDDLFVINQDEDIVPAQFSVLSRWGAGIHNTSVPIKWINVQIPTEVNAEDEVTYTLAQCIGFSPQDPNAISLQSTNNIHIINTGPATFVLDENLISLFQSITLNNHQIYQQSTSAGPKVIDGAGNNLQAYHGPYDEFSIEEQGPVKIVVKTMGHFTQGRIEPHCDQDLGYVARFTFTRNSPDILIEYQLINECGDGMIYGNELAPITNYNNWWNKRYEIQETSWNFPLTFQNTKRSYAAGTQAIYTSPQGFSGTTKVEQEIGATTNPNWRRASIFRDTIMQHSQEEYTSPVVGIGDNHYTALISMPWMRYREPQALVAQDFTLSFKFLSDSTVIGEAQGIWNFGKLSFINANPSNSQFREKQSQDIAELERGLLVHVPVSYLETTNIMPPINFSVTNPAGILYTQFIETIHEDQVEEQWEKNKAYGYTWPDYDIYSDYNGVHSTPTQHIPYSNYWDATDAEAKQWFLTGDPKWIHDFALPQVYTQLVTNYYNVGTRHYEGAGSTRGAFSITTAGFNAPGEAYRTGGGSDDYTYALGFSQVYTARPSGMIRERFADAADTYMRRYNIPRGEQRDHWVNSQELRRGTSQHLMLLLDAAEFSERNGTAYRAKTQEVIDEYILDNFAAGIFCTADEGNTQSCTTDSGGLFHLTQGEIVPFLDYIYWVGEDDPRAIPLKNTFATSATYIHQSIMRAQPNGNIPINNDWFTTGTIDPSVKWYDLMSCTFTNNGQTVQSCQGQDRFAPNGNPLEPFLPHAAPGALGFILLGEHFQNNLALCNGASTILPISMGPQTAWMADAQKIGWNKGAAQGSHNVLHAVALSERC